MSFRCVLLERLSYRHAAHQKVKTPNHAVQGIMAQYASADDQIMGYDANIETWTLDDGKKLTLRHIAPADAIREQAFVRKLSVQSRYLRFLRRCLSDSQRIPLVSGTLLLFTLG